MLSVYLCYVLVKYEERRESIQPAKFIQAKQDQKGQEDEEFEEKMKKRERGRGGGEKLGAGGGGEKGKAYLPTWMRTYE